MTRRMAQENYRVWDRDSEEVRKGKRQRRIQKSPTICPTGVPQGKNTEERGRDNTQRYNDDDFPELKKDMSLHIEESYPVIRRINK